MGYRFYFLFPLTLTSEVCLLRWPKQLDCFSVMNKEILPSFPDISQIPPLSPIFFPILNNCSFIKSFAGILCPLLYYIAIRVLLFTGHVPFPGCKLLKALVLCLLQSEKLKTYFTLNLQNSINDLRQRYCENGNF